MVLAWARPANPKRQFSHAESASSSWAERRSGALASTSMRCRSSSPSSSRSVDDSVLVRTIPGTKLDAATIGAVVAFQADAWEPSEGTHWSVLLQGIASEVDDESSSLSNVTIRSWAGVGGVHRSVRIDATNASGRRFRIAGEGPEVELPDPPPF